MVAEVDSELREIHHVRYTPTPYAAAYVDWSVDPYGGGANYWNIHARSPDVIPRMTQPVPPLPVYVCGGVLELERLCRKRARDRRARPAEPLRARPARLVDLIATRRPRTHAGRSASASLPCRRQPNPCRPTRTATPSVPGARPCCTSVGMADQGWKKRRGRSGSAGAWGLNLPASLMAAIIGDPKVWRHSCSPIESRPWRFQIRLARSSTTRLRGPWIRG